MTDALSVSQLTNALKTTLQDSPLLNDVWVEGEVTDYRTITGSGHTYLTLKDPRTGDMIKATIWRTTALRMGQMPANGQRVRARGDVGIYAQRSEYQFNIRMIVPAGIGDLFIEFERLKAELTAEGVFDAGRKRPLPAYPAVIGIVTSAEAAALQDVLNVLRRRWPLGRVVLAASPVQGVDAPPGIVRALFRLNAQPDVQVILVCRGGGSLEDLWAFNDPRVVRAVATSRLPVISGVGHETDFTLTDFAADLRAPTPSAAAEQLTPDRAELQAGLHITQSRLITAMQNVLADGRDRVTAERRLLEAASPAYVIATGRQRVDDLAARLKTSSIRALAARRERLAFTERALAAASPQALLERGYALVTDEAGVRVSSTADAPVGGGRLHIRFKDGTITAVRTE